MKPVRQLKTVVLPAPLGPMMRRLLFHVQATFVDGQQAAKAHGQSEILQHLAHFGSSRWGRVIGSNPCGRQIIMTTITDQTQHAVFAELAGIISGSTS